MTRKCILNALYAFKTLNHIYWKKLKNRNKFIYNLFYINFINVYKIYFIQITRSQIWSRNIISRFSGHIKCCSGPIKCFSPRNWCRKNNLAVFPRSFEPIDLDYNLRIMYKMLSAVKIKCFYEQCVKSYIRGL